MVPAVDPKLVPVGSKVVRFIGRVVHTIVCDEAKARNYLSMFRNKVCDFFTDEEGTWVVRAADITTIEIIDYSVMVERQRQQMAAEPLQQPPGFSFSKRSGVS